MIFRNVKRALLCEISLLSVNPFFCYYQNRFDYQTTVSISTRPSIITGRPNGKACTPIAERACIPISEPYNERIRSEKPLATSVVCVNPSTAFTITITCSHAVTLSNVPSSRLRLLNIDKPANFADSYLAPQILYLLLPFQMALQWSRLDSVIHGLRCMLYFLLHVPM